MKTTRAKKNGATQKRWTKMNAKELAIATAEYDKPFAAIRASRPLSAAGIAAHRNAKRGRPLVGEGAEKIALSIERGLLRRVDAYAKARGISRAQLVARSLEELLRAS